MYYEIEGQLSIEPVIFDEEELIALGHRYPYEEIESIEITSAPLFSTYGILSVRTHGKDIAVPFVRSKRQKLERVLKEFERMRKKEAASSGSAAAAPASRPAVAPARDSESAPTRDPYEELKKLKELLDMGIITQEEFDTKKRQLLDL